MLVLGHRGDFAGWCDCIDWSQLVWDAIVVMESERRSAT